MKSIKLKNVLFGLLVLTCANSSLSAWSLPPEKKPRNQSEPLCKNVLPTDNEVTPFPGKLLTNRSKMDPKVLNSLVQYLNRLNRLGHLVYSDLNFVGIRSYCEGTLRSLLSDNA